MTLILGQGCRSTYLLYGLIIIFSLLFYLSVSLGILLGWQREFGYCRQRQIQEREASFNSALKRYDNIVKGVSHMNLEAIQTFLASSSVMRT